MPNRASVLLSNHCFFDNCSTYYQFCLTQNLGKIVSKRASYFRSNVKARRAFPTFE